ncbi:hypothetical protein AXF42_Ash005047 [Apostasia shenzhenica]|uniref:GTD-binding domain-containing protein n=1 Tax=Apostasia shenzhenica TaxID=1088818 RepID=A0A2I0B8B1_9ASPA|nr:hypothetical protein AXF42_Ash005047 [Apostasia shenzhenica]
MDLDPDGGGEDRLPCNCSCLCCGTGTLPSSASWCRTLKRKVDQAEEDARRGRINAVARVEIENEAAALREALGSHQLSIQELHAELEEERAAASTAAAEAMSMILRLQREKAEAQMDARQFKRVAEEKMAHDQQEIALLEDLLFKRDQAVQSLSCEIQAYRHRLLSYGVNPSPSEPNSPDGTEEMTPNGAACNDFYPPLRCESSGFPVNVTLAASDPDNKNSSGNTPRERLQRLPSVVMEKGVVGLGHSPRWGQRSLRRLSMDSFGSCSFRQELGNHEFPVMVDGSAEAGAGGRDDMSDRIYTIDAIHGVDGMHDELMSTPREFMGRTEAGGGNVDHEEIKRLYLRLQALEADRESMRQVIMSMGKDEAQMVLLREIAKQLCKGVRPQRGVAKNPSFSRRFSVASMIKWVTSFFFWRKKSSNIKYPFGLPYHGPGLLLLLEKNQRTRQRRCLTRVPM